MAQAFRFRKQIKTKTNTNQIVVKGTYELDKVVVEWERLILIDELSNFISCLPTRTYKKSELRFYFSGYLQDSDTQLPDTKFRDYRISGRSLNRIIELLELKGVLEKSVHNGELRWQPKFLKPGCISTI